MSWNKQTHFNVALVKHGGATVISFIKYYFYLNNYACV